MLTLVWVLGCGPASGSDAGTGSSDGGIDAASSEDAGRTADAGRDGGPDAGGGTSDAGGGADAGATDAGGDAGARDAGPPVDPIPLTCEDVRGTMVCAASIDPTLVDSAVSPVPTGLGGGGGEGSHWFCRPAAASEWNGRALLHLVGTYSDPLDDHRFAEHACAEGWAAMVPMYENRNHPRDICGDDGPCYEAFHREILFGEPGAPDPVDVHPVDAIDARALGLIAHLARGGDAAGPWSSVAAALSVDDFRAVAVSGHSQGAGHAVYLGGERAAERVVILAGPSDRIGDGTPGHAAVPWVASFAPATAADRFFGYIHRDDMVANVDQVIATWDALGVGADSCDHANAGGYPATCRRIFVPSAGCGEVLAHSVPVVRAWTGTCFPLLSGAHDNYATWSFLLDG